MDRYAEYLLFAEQLADQAGEVMKRYFNAEDIGTTTKDNDTPVTVADTKINQLVIDAVREAYPSHGVLGEEGSYAEDREYLWVCDPIDGTFPFSHGIPIFTFSLALVQNGVPLVAVIYDPTMDRMCSAITGQGAWMNDEELSLLPEYPTTGMRGVEVEVWGNNDAALFDDVELSYKIDRSLSEVGFMNLFFCSVAYHGLLCATGKSIGFVFGGKNSWDVAAAALIVSEAGGVVSDCFGARDNLLFDGPVKGLIVARNEAEHKQITDAVVPIFREAKLRLA